MSFFFFGTVKSLTAKGAKGAMRSEISLVPQLRLALSLSERTSGTNAQTCSSFAPVASFAVIIEAMDERDFFDEKEAKKPATLNCPHCHQANEYELSWLVRTKKRQLPGRA
ncbi:MAG TPA: hypothetical protein VJV96_15505, partial [Candidatus Angelobacter sp.]|nr:hypothetical protein [Candidatus Angelobacter sp.]